MDTGKKKRGSLKNKLVLNAYAAMVIIFILTFFGYNLLSRYEIEQQLETRLMSTVKTAAMLVDVQDFNALVSKDQETSPEYRRVRKTLLDFKQANPDILFIYTVRKSSEKNIFEFVVDADKKPFHIGDKYDVTAQQTVKKALMAPISDMDIETNQWGSYISGYAPIKDEAGKTVGVVGIDLSIEGIFESAKRHVILVSLVILIFSIMITSFYNRKRVKNVIIPVIQMREGIKRMLEGKADSTIRINTNDEYEDFADMLNDFSRYMVGHRDNIEVDLRSAQEVEEKMLNLYGNLISSVSQGKFNLISYRESGRIAAQGVLYDEMKLSAPEDVDKARQLMERILREKGFSEHRTKNITMCVSEAAVNVIKHGQNGNMQVRLNDEGVRVTLLDHGTGLDLEKLPNMILLEGYAMKEPLGLGFSLINRYADKIYLSTSRQGTFLALDFDQRNEVEREEMM